MSYLPVVGECLGRLNAAARSFGHGVGVWNSRIGDPHLFAATNTAVDSWITIFPSLGRDSVFYKVDFGGLNLCELKASGDGFLTTPFGREPACSEIVEDFAKSVEMVIQKSHSPSPLPVSPGQWTRRVLRTIHAMSKEEVSANGYQSVWGAAAGHGEHTWERRFIVSWGIRKRLGLVRIFGQSKGVDYDRIAALCDGRPLDVNYEISTVLQREFGPLVDGRPYIREQHFEDLRLDIIQCSEKETPFENDWRARQDFFRVVR